MDELARLQVENKKVRDRCKELENAEENCRVLQIQCESTRDNMNILECDKQTLQQSNERLSKELLDLNSKFTEEEQERGRLEKELEEAEKKLMGTNLQLDEMKNEMELFKQQQAQVIANFKQLIQEAHSKIEKLQQDNEEFNSCLGNADAELQKKIKQNEELRNSLKQQQINFEEIFKKSDQAIKDKDAQIGKLKQELSESHSSEETVKTMLENKDLRAKNKKITTDLITTLNQNADLQSRNDQYEEQVNDLEDRLNKATKNIEELKAKLMEFEKSNEALEETLHNTKNSLEQTTTERDGLAEDKLKLEGSLAELTLKHEELQQNQKVVTAQLINAMQQKDDLKKEFEAMDELKKGSLENIESNMKIMFSKITSSSEQFFNEIQTSRQLINDGFLKLGLDEDMRQ